MKPEVEEEFWLVWNLEGRNPRYKHTNEIAAKEEAMRLAAQNPGQSFYLVRAITVVRSGEVAVTPLAENIPF